MSEQYCPLCQQKVKHNPRYPNYVCRDCLKDGVEVEGEMVALNTIDVYYQPQVLCKVKGIECVAYEARFGGTVVEVIINDN